MLTTPNCTLLSCVFLRWMSLPLLFEYSKLIKQRQESINNFFKVEDMQKIALIILFMLSVSFIKAVIESSKGDYRSLNYIEIWLENKGAFN